MKCKSPNNALERILNGSRVRAASTTEYFALAARSHRYRASAQRKR